MNKTDRAKQFLPFDSLKGLQEELRKREERRTRQPKRLLSEERKEEISSTLLRLTKGAKIRIAFFLDGHYPEIEGEVSELNFPLKYLMLGNEKIFFDDIFFLTALSR